VDSNRNVYVVGETDSSNYPFTPMLAERNAGNGDALSASCRQPGTVFSIPPILAVQDSRPEWHRRGQQWQRLHHRRDRLRRRPSWLPWRQCLPSRRRGSDAFVAKFSTTSGSIIYASQLGYAMEDRGLAIALDSTGNIYVTGETVWSTDTNTPPTFPIVNALQPNMEEDSPMHSLQNQLEQLRARDRFLHLLAAR